MKIGLYLGHPTGISAIQQAINILTSAGPGAWYDPSDIASYTYPVGPELEPVLNFATWGSGGNVSAVTASSFTTTAAGGLYKSVTSWSAAMHHKVRIAGTSTVAWNLRNTENGTGMVSVPAGPFSLDVVSAFLKASTLGQVYIQPTAAGTVTLSSYSVVELTNIAACTMFQDSAGTTPVTAVEQPVGLMLDKSQSIGSELITSLDFATWSSTAVSAKAGSSFTTTASGGCWLAVPGWSATKSYRLVISGTCANAWQLRNADNALNIISVSSGAFSLNVPITLMLQNSSGNLYFQTIGAATFTVTSISLKELPGNHLIQPTATSRPTLSSRYNLLTKTDDFSGSAWSLSATAVTRGVDSITGDGTAAYHYTGQVLPTYIAGSQYEFRFEAKADGVNAVQVITSVGPGFANFDLVSGGSGGAVGSGWSSATAAPIAEGWFACSVRLIPLGGNIYIALVSSASAVRVESWVTSGGIRIRNAHLVPVSDASLPYQRVNTTTDYDSDFSKFPPFVKFDGIDDSLYTATSVDFTSTDKMTVFAGVHKASDAALGMFLEYGNGAADSSQVIQVQIPGSTPAVEKVVTYSVGTSPAGVVEASAFSAPSSFVYTASTDISGDLLTVRLNAAQIGTGTSDQGTGNWGNKSLYIGRRNNASFPFNGRLYQLALKGKALSAAEISTVEALINSRTKAY